MLLSTPQLILNQPNDVLCLAVDQWDVSITQRSGDATHFALQAIEEGAELVGAHGGDGTIMEVTYTPYPEPTELSLNEGV